MNTPSICGLRRATQTRRHVRQCLDVSDQIRSEQNNNMGGGGGARKCPIRWSARFDGSVTAATDISIGGMAGNGLSGTDAVCASTCVACSGTQCFWHNGLAGVS